MSKKELLWLLPIFAFVLILYFPVFGVYFSQDDFFHFKVSQTDGSLRSFIKLFGFPSFEERGYGFYRPIFREGLYNVYYSLFGLNIFPFRVLSFILHFINISLVYTLVQRLFKDKRVSLFTAFFFGISAANVAVLYYLAGGIQILGATMFLLLSIIFFFKYLNKEGLRFKILSFVTFLLGLGSHEVAAVILALLTLTIFAKILFKKAVYKAIVELWPFLVLLGVYLYLDIFKVGFSQSEQQYKAVFSIQKTINSFAWYSVWALGMPEMLIDFIRPGLKLNPSLMRHWSDYFSIIFTAFFFSIGFLVLSLLSLFEQSKKIFRSKEFLLLVIWFPVTILPILFLPLHKSTYYLAPALPAFWGILGFLIFKTYALIKKKNLRAASAILGGALVSLFILSATSAILGSSTYWAAARGRLAQKLLSDLKSNYFQLPKNSAVYFLNDPEYPFVAEEWGSTSKQAAFVLNKEDALQLLYKDPTLRVFYEDLGGVPSDFPRDRVYSLVAELE